jgi:hypothetical protein
VVLLLVRCKRAGLHSGDEFLESTVTNNFSGNGTAAKSYTHYAAGITLESVSLATSNEIGRATLRKEVLGVTDPNLAGYGGQPTNG